MNIKQAEEKSGVSRQNIRFYEREGLLTPDRNPENDYREYTQGHIETLKKIRALRALDMPLDQIRLILREEETLGNAAAKQQLALQKKMEKLADAVKFCQELLDVENLHQWNVDEMLSRMDRPEHRPALSRKWLDDYKQVVLSESQKRFTFIPDDAVTNPSEFTNALFAFARKQGLDLVITREGMYPEFTIDGIEYTAERYYTHVRGIPVATISCRVKYPEDFEPDVPETRKKLMKLLNFSWLLIPAILILLIWLVPADRRELLTSWEGWMILLTVLVLLGTGIYRTWLFHFNEKQS